jgi:hypothetical protein
LSHSLSALLYVFFVVVGLELRAFTWSHSTSPTFCDRVSQDKVSGTICPGWLQTVILLSLPPEQLGLQA